MNKKQIRGFTLVEMLIVLGIIALLSVTLVLAINPAEAQRKSRDTKRLKDLTTIEAIVNQVVTDGSATYSACLTSANGCNSATYGGTHGCATNWLGLNLCQYAQNIPLDPLNGRLVQYATGGTAIIPGRGTDLTGGYRARVSGQDYVVGVRVESGSNLHYLTETGWTGGAFSYNWYVVGTDVTSMTFPSN